MNRSTQQFGNAQQPEEILGQVVKNASQYNIMRTPGPLQPSHFLPPFSGELILLTVPDVVNPLDLINCEVAVGGKNESVFVAGGQKFSVATYPAANLEKTSRPSLFVPDQDGQLTKIPAAMKASLVVKGVVDEQDENDQDIDIDALRSTRYKAPKDLRRRDFFAKTKTQTLEMKATIKKKREPVDSSGELDSSLPSSGEVPRPAKKKKTKQLTSESDDALDKSINYPKKKVKKELIAELRQENLSSPFVKGKKKK